MDKKDIKKRIRELQTSIEKIADKKNKLLFFVVDSKGTPIGSLSYIYGIAYKLKELGYNVQMLYAEKDFVGVESWLGEKYAKLPHFNVTKDFVDVSPEDILFIPELFSSIMAKTRELRCKKVAVLQNFEYMTELIPFGATWDGMDIHDCLTTSKALEDRLHEVFPNIRTYVVRPVIDKVFKPRRKKQLIVNIVSKDEKYINSIVKPFKWKYPAYGFVTFRYISNKPHEEFAQYLSEGEITIWVDPMTDFGYSALEAMACGNLVIGKIPENNPEWMFTLDGKLIDNGVWFYNMRELPDILASVIQNLLHCNIPQEIYDNANVVLSEYTDELQDEDIKNLITEKIITNREKELKLILDAFKNKLEKTEE